MINWSQVEVGDVMEFRDESREKIETHSEGDWETMLYPVEINDIEYAWNGQTDILTEGPLDIVAIHKPGTVGAMSHEERSRLWDKCEEYGIWIRLSHRPEGKWVAWCDEPLQDGHGATQLEAVAKCVAAIEAQTKESANVKVD